MSGTKICPFCAEEIRAEAVKCRYCGSFLEPETRALVEPWTRPAEGRVLAGVCAGLAERFGISVSVLRLAFLIGALFSAGVAVLLYIALWIAMPPEEPPHRRLDAGPGAPPAPPTRSG